MQVLTVDGAFLCVLDLTVVAGIARMCLFLYGVAVYPDTVEMEEQQQSCGDTVVVLRYVVTNSFSENPSEVMLFSSALS